MFLSCIFMYVLPSFSKNSPKNIFFHKRLIPFIASSKKFLKKKIKLETLILNFFILLPIALSFQTNALKAFTQFNVTILCCSNRAKKVQTQSFMQHYKKKSCGKKFSSRKFNIKNLVEEEKICRNVLSANTAQ